MFDKRTTKNLKELETNIKHWASKYNPSRDKEMCCSTIAQKAWLRYMMNPLLKGDKKAKIEGWQLYETLYGDTQHNANGILGEPRFVQALSKSTEWYYFHEKLRKSDVQKVLRRWTVFFPNLDEKENMTFAQAAEQAYKAHTKRNASTSPDANTNMSLEETPLISSADPIPMMQRTTRLKAVRKV